MSMTAVQIASVALVLFACVPDVRTRRIPNALTFGCRGHRTAVPRSDRWMGRAGGSSLGGWALGAALFFPILPSAGWAAAT